jgi:hypothetical protein
MLEHVSNSGASMAKTLQTRPERGSLRAGHAQFGAEGRKIVF